jgi:hypothetical protein
MRNEMGTIAQSFGNVARIEFEVFAIGWWALAESAAIQGEHCPAIGQRILRLPHRRAPRDAPMHEQDPRSGVTLVDAQVGRHLPPATHILWALFVD